MKATTRDLLEAVGEALLVVVPILLLAALAVALILEWLR